VAGIPLVYPDVRDDQGVGRGVRYGPSVGPYDRRLRAGRETRDGRKDDFARCGRHLGRDEEEGRQRKGGRITSTMKRSPSLEQASGRTGQRKPGLVGVSRE